VRIGRSRSSKVIDFGTNRKRVWQVYSEGPSEQKPLKNLGEKGAWAYSGTVQIFGVGYPLSGTLKATNFNFCTHILSIDRNKSPLQILGKVAGCVVRTLEIVQGTRILGASRGRLCDSSAVLFKHGIFATDFSFTNKILLESDCGCLRGRCACSNGLGVVWGVILNVL